MEFIVPSSSEPGLDKFGDFRLSKGLGKTRFLRTGDVGQTHACK
jgi:hypothetical protein